MVANKLYTATNHRNIKQGVGYGGCLRLMKRLKLCRIFFQMLILAALVLIAFSGCSEKIAYKEVYLPQKCELTPKARPLKTDKVTQDLKQALVYTELLEQDLAICRGEKGVSDE